MASDVKQLEELLTLIEEQIDLEHCRKVDECYQRALSFEPTSRPPLVVQSAFGKNWELPGPWDRFEFFSYRQAFDDPVAMMQNMLLNRVVPGLILKDDNPLAIRNDHGTIQIASLLSGQWHFHEDNYPWVGSLGSVDAVKEQIEKDEIPWDGGVLPQSTRTLEFYREQLSKYPKCNKAIQISLPDLQGPIDTADILWGSELFAEILASPELVNALLSRIVDVMIAVANYYRRFAKDRLEPFANSQHGYNIPGRLLIRNDSAIMVSPNTYREMIMPHDARLLNEIGTGSIHFCGNGEHLIEPILEVPDLRGIDVGEPEMIDIGRVYEMCVKAKVAITNLKPSRDDLVSGKAVQEYPTGVVFVYNTEDIEDAVDVVDRYRNSAS